MGTINCRKLIVAAAAGFAFTTSLTSIHGQIPGKQYMTEPSKIRSATPTPDPNIPNTGSEKVTAKGAAEIDAEAREKGRKETMVIETAPRKRSTPSPEFAGSLLDVGLPKISNEKGSTTTSAPSNSRTTKTNLPLDAAPAAQPKETPSVKPTPAQIAAPSLSLSTTPTPTASLRP